MNCDWLALLRFDNPDPEAVIDNFGACVSDPQLWFWSIVLTVGGAAGGFLIGRYKNAVLRDTVLGAALGPIGWIVSLFLPKGKTPAKCPSCGRPVEAKDAHCRHCGAALRPRA